MWPDWAVEGENRGSLAEAEAESVRMELANSLYNTSMGLLRDLKMTLGGYDFNLQV